MKIVISKQSNVKVRHNSPTFSYDFDAVGDRVEMPDDHAAMVCSNPDFEIVCDVHDAEPDDLFFNGLRAIKGIGAKTAKDIVDIYKDKKHLMSAIKHGKVKGLRDDIEGILQKHYEHEMSGDDDGEL